MYYICIMVLEVRVILIKLVVARASMFVRVSVGVVMRVTSIGLLLGLDSSWNSQMLGNPLLYLLDRHGLSCILFYDTTIRSHDAQLGYSFHREFTHHWLSAVVLKGNGHPGVMSSIIRFEFFFGVVCRAEHYFKGKVQRLGFSVDLF